MTVTPATDDNPYDPLNPDDPDPIGHLAQARRRCPVSQPRPGTFVVARHDDVTALLQCPMDYSSEDNFMLDGGTPTAALPATPITMMDPPAHTALRSRLRRWFAPVKLRREESRVRAIISDLLGPLRAGQQIELWSTVARVLPSRTVYALLGLPSRDWDRIQDLADAVNDHFPQVSMEMPEMAELAGYLAQLVASSATVDHGSGVVYGLAHPEEGEQALEPVEIVMHCIQLILAGTDTTGSLITNLLYELLVEPSRWEQLVENPSLIPHAIEESLRHDAPLQYVLRTATTDDEVAGCPIAAGNRVVLSLQSANLDERVWGSDASAFVLDREPGRATLATFGYGIHTCLGAPLARLEARLLIEAMTQQFPHMRLAPGYAYQRVAHAMVRRPARLDVVL
jgi:cytochrome P450